MRKRYFALASLTISLVIVGAGCDYSAQQQGDVGGSAGHDETSESVDAKINAAVDTALQASTKEENTQKDGEKDADMAGSDSAELDAYGNAQYDVK